MTKQKMKRRGWARAVVAGLGLALFAVSTAAEKFSFDGRSLEVPIPPGFCKLEESGPDAVMRKAIAPDLSPDLGLLFAFVECEALPALRKNPHGPGGVAFGSVALMLKDGKPAPMKQTRGDLVVGGAGLASERDQVRAQVDAWMRTQSLPNVAERKEVGIADVDPSGLFILGTVTVSGNTKPTLLVQTMSTTIVNGMGIIVTSNEPVGPRTTLSGILAEQKRNLAALVAANRS
ncbi:hypothetical protein D3C85_727790 [compost metagenome]